MKITNFRRKELALAVAYSALVAATSTVAYAQEESAASASLPQVPRPQFTAPAIEEIVVTTRLKDSATEIILERLEQPFAAEVLGVDQIVRVGDSDVAAALRRVTGLTLVGGQYVYVRGLGERYSSTTLNGAAVPSPELSRNVIPLDLFPTSILSSLKVHKAYSPGQPAAFGGGNIDIRTRGVPDAPLFNVSFATGWNSEHSGKGLVTVGDGGDLPSAIKHAIVAYQGDVSTNNISRLIGDTAQAVRVNRDLMLSLNRDIEIEERSLDPDTDASVTAGNSWILNADWELGVLASGGQETQFRNRHQIKRDYSAPHQEYDLVTRTIEEENTTLALNLGLNYQGKHALNTNSYLLRNHEDQSSIALGQNQDFSLADGQQRKTYSTRLEERELVVNQVIGSHSLEDGDFGFLRLPGVVSAINVSWIYSESTASTEVPNATTVQASNRFDTTTGALVSNQLNVGSPAQFSFLNLGDEVESGGFEVELPFELGSFYGALSGGYLDTTKTREYYGYTANIDAVSSSSRSGTPGQVLSDDNIGRPESGFSLSLGSQFGTESYIAAEAIEAIYGTFDATFLDTWRMTVGVRYEDFTRGGPLPLDLLDYSGESVNRLISEVQQPDTAYAFQDDGYYPSLALTYMRDGVMGAENFQARLSYGKTVVRPDLREVSPVMWLDPELNVRMKGNPNLAVADVDHADLRAELFYGDGSSLTASLFYKDIANPIEQVELPGSLDSRVLSFTNADAGEVYGLELEGLKELGRGFFLTGNLVLSDSEIDFGGRSAQTSDRRRLTGHSEYVINAQLGYDSDDGQHSVSTVYNVFGERVFAGGRQPKPDWYEEPFHALDLVYSFYPTDQATVKLKMQNLLREEREFTQDGVTVIEEQVGTSFGLDFKWDF